MEAQAPAGLGLGTVRERPSVRGPGPGFSLEPDGRFWKQPALMSFIPVLIYLVWARPGCGCG